MQDFLPKLKQNILPRLLSRVKAAHEDPENCLIPEAADCDANRAVVIKDDRIFMHNIFRVNYTSYDVRRLQDVINARSTHCNIMVLCDTHNDSSSSHFRYGRVIGTYHVKAIYTGPGMKNHYSHPFEFLWVRWYDEVGQAGTGWQHSRLNRLRFAPLNDNDAFDIIDPADVLRGCHVLPRFSLGPRHSDGVGLSPLAQDSSDWTEYYINRSVIQLSAVINELHTETFIQIC